jgi:phage N-6-adenine-methyltransferase
MMSRPKKYRSNADRQRAYRRRKQQPAYLRSRSQLWETPQKLFAELDAEFGFTCDVAALPTSAKCPVYFTPEQDGLKQRWTGVCFCNPPYGPTVGKWMAKAYESSLDGVTVVLLVPSRTDTRWWHDFAMRGEVRFLKGRVCFGNGDTPAPFPSAVVIFRPPTKR